MTPALPFSNFKSIYIDEFRPLIPIQEGWVPSGFGVHIVADPRGELLRADLPRLHRSAPYRAGKPATRATQSEDGAKMVANNLLAPKSA